MVVGGERKAETAKGKRDGGALSGERSRKKMNEIGPDERERELEIKAW